MSYSDNLKTTALAAAVVAASTTPALGYEYRQGDFSMQVDTTVSVGASWRASERNNENVGLLNTTLATGDPTASHRHGSSAADDGDLNWKKGSTFSEVAKITMDIEMNYLSYGAFVRGKAFYDHRIVNGDGVTDAPAYYQLPGVNGNELAPNQSSGRSADILDAFIWGDWYINNMPLNVRLGKQVISWGEGLLYANGINSINPVDVSALLAPGSEVKDALLPLNALSGSIGLTNAVTLEAFYLFEWRETELPECGTYFSLTDLVGPGCWGGFVPNGTEYNAPAAIGLPPASAITLPRVGDEEPDNGGEYGIAVRYFAESIETEFSLYYMNLHSRLPVISGHFPDVTQLGFTTLDEARETLTAPPGGLAGLNPADPSTWGNPLATSILLPYGDYFLDYVEDIPLLGASFSSTFDFGLPGGATAVSGEISIRKDQPFAREDGDSLAGAVGLMSLACADAPTPYDCYSQYGPGEFNQGYVEADYFQAEMVFIHFFDQVLGASRWTAVLDIAGSYLDLPSKREALLNSNYNATLNFPNLPSVAYTIPGHPVYGGPGESLFFPVTGFAYPAFIDAVSVSNSAVAPEDKYYPTSGAWGYKLRFAGEYNNVFAGVNLRPVISFSHDVYGTTPSPIANFLEDRKALGLSVEGVILNDYSVKVSYTDFYGAEPYNALADRDYYSLSATASF